MVITVQGETNTAGWTNFSLCPLWNRTNPPLHGVYAFSFEGEPPVGPAAEVISETGPVSYTLTVGETSDACKIIVYAEANFMEKQVSSSAEKKSQPFSQSNPAGSRASGYSNNWDLKEAFKDAISNLPVDPYPHPDKLYHYKILSIGAEIGGIAGFNRLVVKIEG